MRGRNIGELVFHALTLVGVVSLVVLFVFGCGQREEPAPATVGTSTVAPSQPSASTISAPEPEKTPATEPSAPAASAQAPDVSPQPLPPPADAVTQSASARIADFMQKMEEKLDLTADQKAQVESVMQEFLTATQQRFEQMQLTGQAQGRQAGARPALTDEQRAQFANMRQGQGPMNTQPADKLKDILTPDQLQVFEQLLDDLQKQMAVDQAIRQMGENPPAGNGK